MSKVARKVALWFGTAAVLAGIVIVSLQASGYKRFVIGNTTCMAPTLKTGDLIFTKEYNPNLQVLKRFQIVAFQSPLEGPAGKTWVMRVVGLPGERLEVMTNSLLVNGAVIAEEELPAVLRDKKWLTTKLIGSSLQRQWELGSDQVFVVGDNLDAANDSRYWGPLSLTHIIGIVERRAKGQQTHVRFGPIHFTLTSQKDPAEPITKDK